MNDELDTHLRDWAERHAVDDTHLDSLTARISDAARRQMNERHREPVFVTWRVKLGYVATGAVAALAMVAALHLPSLRPDLEEADGAALAFAGISAEQLRVDRTLFAGMRDLFAERLQWVAESNGDIALGVASGVGDVSEDSVPAHVRLVLLSRNATDDGWQKEWSTDVLLRTEELVEVEAGGNGRNQLALWLYPLKDGRVAIDTDIGIVGPVGIESQASAVQSLGKPRQLLSFRSGNTEYRLLQTVQML